MPDDAKNLTPTSDQLKAVWGDGYGNRPDRFLACVAYLDGVHPSVVMCRGYYTRTVLAAFDWRGGKLSSRWVFDTNTPGNEKFAGQGNHNLSVADVDGDGKDEIIYGKMAVDDNGKGLYSTGIGHGDAIHVSDLDPSRPGLEVFSIQEPFADAGLNFFDAKTGEVLWKKASIKAGADGEGPARGVALDIDPRTPGFECWGAGAGMWGKVFDAKGNQIETDGKSPPVNFGIYWDGDLLSELLDSTTISKWDWNANQTNALLDAKEWGCVSNNGTKATPVLSGDIVGDWREEVIYRTEDNRELRIFSTTIPTNMSGDGVSALHIGETLADAAIQILIEKGADALTHEYFKGDPELAEKIIYHYGIDNFNAYKEAHKDVVLLAFSAAATGIVRPLVSLFFPHNKNE